MRSKPFKKHGQLSKSEVEFDQQSTQKEKKSFLGQLGRVLCQVTQEIIMIKIKILIMLLSINSVSIFCLLVNNAVTR